MNRPLLRIADYYRSPYRPPLRDADISLATGR
jgi:hypothetical protein